MKLGRIRNYVQVQIENEYAVIKRFIEEANTLFISQRTLLEKEAEREEAMVNEIDPDIQYSISHSISNYYNPIIEEYDELIYTSRRTLLIAVFTYTESNLKRILELYNIKKKGNKIGDILSSIENKKGKLPSKADPLRKLVFQDLRKLRNHCAHQGTCSKGTLSMIEKIPKLSISNNELLVDNIRVLLTFLDASKELLEIIEEHCRQNP